VAAEDAVFGFPEVGVGIFPGAGGVIRLPRVVGHGVARDLLYTGRRIDAAEALRVGLADRRRPAGDGAGGSLERGRQIAANAPLAIRAMKRGPGRRRTAARPRRRPVLVMAERCPGPIGGLRGGDHGLRGEAAAAV
jgi:enoyl-CoA hydratase/carnithine racemase